jgi:hypothetical protein
MVGRNARRAHAAGSGPDDEQIDVVISHARAPSSFESVQA